MGVNRACSAAFCIHLPVVYDGSTVETMRASEVVSMPICSESIMPAPVRPDDTDGAPLPVEVPQVGAILHPMHCQAAAFAVTCPKGRSLAGEITIAARHATCGIERPVRGVSRTRNSGKPPITSRSMKRGWQVRNGGTAQAGLAEDGKLKSVTCRFGYDVTGCR